MDITMGNVIYFFVDDIIIILCRTDLLPRSLNGHEYYELLLLPFNLFSHRGIIF
jgi:hypothetical protein